VERYARLYPHPVQAHVMGTYGTPPEDNKCAACGGTAADIRPYGPHGEWICHYCYAFDSPISPYISDDDKGGSN
jgi:recombinational DNA repair protein (RecF pathway)